MKNIDFKHIVSVGAVALLASGYSTSFAQTSYLKCDQDLGFALAQCHLTGSVIENTEPAFEGERYEAEFSINANATCGPNAYSSGIYLSASGRDNRSPEIRLGTQTQARLTGMGPVQIFTDDVTNRLGKRQAASPCGLTVDVSAHPSQATVQIWISQAQILTANLKSLADIYSSKSIMIFWFETYISSPDATQTVLLEMQNQLNENGSESSKIQAQAIQLILDKSPREQIDALYSGYRARIESEIPAAEKSIRKLNFINSSESATLSAAIGEALNATK